MTLIILLVKINESKQKRAMSEFLRVLFFLQLCANNITYADGSRVSKAIIRVCVRDYVCVSVCQHDKTKTAENTITKLGTGIVHREISPTTEY